MTAYQFRVRVDDRSFLVQLALQGSSKPRFLDLIEAIRHTIKDLNMDEYQISTHQQDALYDDHSLQHALIRNDPLELVLERNISDRRSLQQQQQQHKPVPIVKPVVRRRSDPQARKDSGVDLDPLEEDKEEQPVRKKQRCLSSSTTTPTTRKLPIPLPTTTNLSTKSVHPLDRLPPITSTTTTLANTTSVTLPGLSSITTDAPPPPPPPQPQPHARSRLYGLTATTTRRRVSSAQHSQHQQQPSFVCDKRMNDGSTCGQTFRRSYDLQRHQTIHLKNRPYCYCEQCGKKFTRMDALRRHERVQGHSNKYSNNNDRRSSSSSSSSSSAQQARA
ncbi:hypothetical protein O0I10_008354 [Lichtheimia ornata]|uniref:C2H2-type domain-containing protein n=1 Tax=Lichtheimia ornata TaxID=688661 RepID=A0AAD7UYH4_9FUNG|nr:uncharacterized protein O0I10_008354 [Lichtheimia ornata]KAJ8655914.1 hypothetical protein O0I10_008354 [Lichtheimia ornata]